MKVFVAFAGYGLLTLQTEAVSHFLNSSCAMLTPKVITSKTLSQCRGHVFKQKHFQFTLENVTLVQYKHCKIPSSVTKCEYY